MVKMLSSAPQLALAPFMFATHAGVRLGFAGPILRRQLGPALIPGGDFLAYTPTCADVVVTTYVKSGTNWALQIAVQLAHRGEASFEHIHQLVAWPESPFTDILMLDDPPPPSPTGLRVIKTHLCATQVPYTEAATYLCLLRDPKEVVVSAYYFFLGALGVREYVSPREWVELWLSEGFAGERWAEHAAGYWALRDAPNVIVRTYAEAKRDLPGLVDALASRVGVELDAGERAAVIERSSLPYMRAHDRCFAPPRLQLIGGSPPKMVRRGRAGGSDELLDAEQQVRIDDHARAQLRRRGSELPYDELFGSRASTDKAGKAAF